MTDLPTNKPPRRKVNWERMGERVGTIFAYGLTGLLILFFVWLVAFKVPAEDAADKAKTIRQANERVLAACGPEGLRKFKIVNGGDEISEYDYEDESREVARVCLGINRDTGP